MSDILDLVAHAAEFPASYKLKMIRAYPTIAQMDADEEYFATPADRDAAFENILRAKNLRRTHEMFLTEAWERAALREHPDAVTDKHGHLVEPVQ